MAMSLYGEVCLEQMKAMVENGAKTAKLEKGAWGDAVQWCLLLCDADKVYGSFRITGENAAPLKELLDACHELAINVSM